MPINPSSGEFISLVEAQAYVSEYRKLHPTEIRGYFAGVDKLKQILEQDNCIGLRMYNGYDLQTAKTNLVIVGVDADEKDMTDGLILEKTEPCPSSCDAGSALNL